MGSWNTMYINAGKIPVGKKYDVQFIYTGTGEVAKLPNGLDDFTKPGCICTIASVKNNIPGTIVINAGYT